ncbi:MAG: HNH endonuclease [Verrucomicrobiae bacterium]|nr:HNH endonuclease [Verrucomicrobiae bacterium]
MIASPRSLVARRVSAAVSAAFVLVLAALAAEGPVPGRPPSIEAVAREFFEAHPNRDLKQEEIVAAILKKRPDAQDPWRTVRKLYQDGWLVKVSKGVYKRVPGRQGTADDEHFSPAVRDAIYARDRDRCVVCGNGRHNGHEICADHIRPRHLDGSSSVENGQTLCSEHNLLKKTYGIYDFYARLVARLEQQARAAGDAKHLAMLERIRAVLKEYGYPSAFRPPERLERDAEKEEKSPRP